jgi:hypothetical protein
MLGKSKCIKMQIPEEKKGRGLFGRGKHKHSILEFTYAISR